MPGRPSSRESAHRNVPTLVGPGACPLPLRILPDPRRRRALRSPPDHIIARKHRGPTQEDNLAWACYLCNLLKGTDLASVDIETGQVVRLFNPRLDNWAEHFRLKDGGIVPLTPIGRVTEYLLQFNQPQSMQERRMLIVAGRYPR